MKVMLIVIMMDTSSSPIKIPDQGNDYHYCHMLPQACDTNVIAHTAMLFCMRYEYVELLAIVMNVNILFKCHILWCFVNKSRTIVDNPTLYS